VRPEIYERHRAVVRAEPLIVVWGRLERRERVTNVLVHRLERIEPPVDRPRDAGVRDADDELVRARAAAPIGQNFGRGGR
jgi:hypothetical protein